MGWGEANHGGRTLLHLLVLVGSLSEGCSSEPPPFAPAADAGRPRQRDDDPCRDVARVADEVLPKVMIVLDRSGSMDEGGRWTAAVDAIRDVTERLDGRLRFGLTLFPTPGGSVCGPGFVSVAPFPNTSTAILRVLVTTAPEGATPTAATLDEVARSFAAPDDESYVLLVTDGGPNCNPSLDPRSCRSTAPDFPNPLNCLDDARTVTSTAALRGLGVPVFVVRLDSEFPDVFDDVAEAGGTEGAFPVERPEMLQETLSRIAAQLASCELRLLERDLRADDIRMTIDGAPLPFVGEADGDGWRFGGAGIQIVGAACEGLRDGQPHDIEATRDCSVI